MMKFVGFIYLNTRNYDFLVVAPYVEKLYRFSSELIIKLVLSPSQVRPFITHINLANVKDLDII